MWFIGVKVEQETSAPPRKKKSWIRPWLMFSDISNSFVHCTDMNHVVLVEYCS